jgi:hypothetical protein
VDVFLLSLGVSHSSSRLFLLSQDEPGIIFKKKILPISISLLLKKNIDTVSAGRTSDECLRCAVGKMDANEYRKYRNCFLNA